MSDPSSTPETGIRSLPVEDRKLLASAIVEGLVNPIGLRFERLATEGGDYSQGQGDYTQSGGGNHNQGGGGYNQSALVRENFLDSIQLANMVRGLRGQ